MGNEEPYLNKLQIMQIDGFNKGIFHHLTTLYLTLGLSLMVYKLKIYSPMEKMKGIFYLRNPSVVLYYVKGVGYSM